MRGRDGAASVARNKGSDRKPPRLVLVLVLGAGGAFSGDPGSAVTCDATPPDPATNGGGRILARRCRHVRPGGGGSGMAVVTLQLGPYAGFVGAHWWQLQSRAGAGAELRADALHRAGRARDPRAPRLVLLDLRGSGAGGWRGAAGRRRVWPP